MRLYHIMTAIQVERARQDDMWGHEFDDKNTPNDWVAYITKYAGIASGGGLPLDVGVYQESLIKVAALAVAALESLDRLNGTPPKRHYD